MRYRPSALGTTRFNSPLGGEDVGAFAFPACGEGRGWGEATFAVRTTAPLLKRAPYRICGRVHRVQSFHRPAVERHNRPAEPASDRDLAQRAPPIADGDDTFRRGHDENVASLAHAGR